MAEAHQESPESSPAERVELRKYPNRRYYDTTRSRHVTVQEIRTMIRDGAEVRIVDSKTGEEITSRVLAQIIMQEDVLQLGLLPTDLMHEFIRASVPAGDFLTYYYQYFRDSLIAFLQWQDHFKHYLGGVLGFRSPGMGLDWPETMLALGAKDGTPPRIAPSGVSGDGHRAGNSAPPAGPLPGEPVSGPSPGETAEAAREEPLSEMLQRLEELQREVAAIQRRIEHRAADGTPPAEPAEAT